MQTTFAVNTLTLPHFSSTNAGAITEEEWLIDNSTGQFTEGGYAIGGLVGNNEEYFWGGTTSTGGVLDYGLGLVGNPPINSRMTLQQKYFPGSPNYVRFLYTTPTDSIPEEHWTITFTPSRYDLGSELYGSYGGSGQTTFYSNYFINSNSQIINQQAYPSYPLVNDSPESIHQDIAPPDDNTGGQYSPYCYC